MRGKGTGLAALGKYDEAITYFDKALSINASDKSALEKKQQVGKRDDSKID
jgi:tetratricopeptide (TPR) repeat protein